MATAGPRRDGQNYVENVIKQGYLKKSVLTNELVTSTTQQFKVNIKQKLEPLRWYVFGVRNRRPYLEYFDKEESVFVGHAIETYDLTMFERLSYTMGTTMPVYSFCIYLSTGNIELTAANRVQMIEWCRTLERHLANLGYKVKRGGDKDDHMYSEFPIKRPPKQTGLEAEMLMEKQALVVDLGSGADDEENENDYEDIPDRKVPLTDAKDENDNDKIPCVPKRPPKLHQAEDHENVFASLYSVSRNGLESSLEEKENSEDRELVEPDSNETFGDTDLFRNFDNHQFSVKGKESHNKWTDVDDDENRCTSLPNFRLESDDTSADTSEDPDFIGASFWLRNRKTEDLILFDVTDPQEAKRKLPPQPSDAPPLVPRRLDSAKKKTLRQCISMTEGSTTSIGGKDRVSPTLELLGQAPKPVPKQRLSKLSPDLQKKNLKESNQSDLNVEYNEFKIKSIKRMERIVSDDLDDDEIGDYEVAPNKLHEDLANGNESDQGVYETAWMCNSHRDSSPHKEKLVVEISDDSTKSFKKGKNGKPDNSAKENIKPKKKFSLRFSKKDKSLKLPEAISVSDNSRNNSADDENDGNLYTDLPGETVPKRDPSTPDAATSDICKISLENGPTHSAETSPVLPRRLKVKGSSKSSELHDKSLKHSPPPHVQPLSSHNHPPSPPQKSRVKSDDSEHLLIKREMETPVAPPRRTRKTVHEEILHSSSKETSKPVINPLSRSITTKLYQPKRDLPSVPVDDPPLPPRDEKPALPPPRKGFGSVSMNEAYKPDIPDRVGRPRSVNITKRQFSTETAALTVMNLKQNQVDILRSEIDSTNGLTRTVTKMQFQSGLAFVECFERIWIAGWDLRNFPRLYDKFHVGDQLIAINDVHVTEVSFAEKLVKNIKADTLDVTIKRLPLAKVFALQREAEGQNLGFKRDGGTAEIIYVDPHGLAARQGLQSKARTIDFVCNWWLTEINMRPLNMFFKDNEIEHRLMAVGRDISIVVQPSDFVKELRKQLKKVRGYKDYLVQ